MIALICSGEGMLSMPARGGWERHRPSGLPDEGRFVGPHAGDPNGNAWLLLRRGQKVRVFEGVELAGKVERLAAPQASQDL